MASFKELSNIGDIKLEFDWGQFEVLGKNFLNSVINYGEEVATKIVDYQKKMIHIAERLHKGEIKEQTARRALIRHRNSVQAYLRSLKEYTKWEAYAAYEHAMDNLLSMVSLLVSSVIKIL